MYDELADQCSQLAVDLLAECRTTSEVELIMHRPTPDYVQSGGRKEPFARVRLALDYYQKKVCILMKVY